MTVTRMETNQAKISEDKANAKQSYRNQVQKGRRRNTTTSVDTVIPASVTVATALTTPSQDPEKTFTHISSQGTCSTTFIDSHGTSRAWKYSFERTLTQNQRTYQVISVNTQLNIEKNLLKPHMEKMKRMVDTLNALAINNDHYGACAVKMNGLYITLMTRLETLADTTNHSVNHAHMLAVLKDCLQDIDHAKEVDVFSQHHSLNRTLPVISAMFKFLDILSNFFEFLDQKIGKLIGGDSTPVFPSAGELSAGMFKPAKTHALAELDKLVADMQWYSKEIETTYQHLAKDDCALFGA